MSYPPISAQQQHQQLPATTQQQQQQQSAHSIASSSTSPQPPGPPQVHKRTYQACIPCRQRKVRCDLGSVEAPHSPPCVRCRRESKNCFFSATRRKTRTNSATVIPRGGAKTIGLGRGSGHVSGVTKREYGDESALYDGLEEEGDSMSTGGFLSRPGGGGVSKKQKVEMSEDDEDGYGVGPGVRGDDREGYGLPPPITVGHHGHDGQYRAGAHVQGPPQQHQTHHNQQAASVSRETLLQGEVYNSHDALHLLYEAAGRGASGPSSPKLKSDSGDNEDDDDVEEEDGDDEDGDDHIMRDTPRSNNDITRQPSTLAAPREIGSAYPVKYEDIDGRGTSINPISHFNGSISTSTSFLRGTGRPGLVKPTLKEVVQSTSKSTGVQVNTPISPVNARGSQAQQQQQQHPAAQPASIKNRASLSQKSVASEMSSIHGGDERDGMQALKAWGKSRFVKSGWFTAKEAISYVDYFFAHHHPLSPLLTTSYQQHSTHPALLQHEPFLATTLLAIASRYLHLPGPGGRSRSYAIHDMLWRELRRGLESVIWGGGGGGPPSRGGLAGLGNSQGKGLRTLGTVEALMVLTEWHVRNLHFPVGGEGGWGAFDGVFGNESDDEDDGSHRRGHHGQPKGGIAGRRARERHRGVVEGLGDRIENILEPAWRSDRMSWMLLGNALTLSYELGVFDDLDEPISSVSTPQSVTTPSSSSHPVAQPPIQQHPPVAPATAYRLRCRRIQKLLVVYVTQLASRLGWTSTIPKNITDALGYKGQYASSHSGLFAAAGQVAFPYNFVKLDSLGRPGTANGTSIPTNNNTTTTNPNSATAAIATSPKTASDPTTPDLNGSGIPIIPRAPTDLQDTVFQCWIDLTMLMKYCGEQCFPSRVGTRDLMRSGKYVSVLENLRPILRGWKEGFEAFGFPRPIHNILILEYEHVRMYINSLALQAIIDRCTTAGVPPPAQQAALVTKEAEEGAEGKKEDSLNPPGQNSSSTTSSEQPSFAVLMKTYGTTDLTFITEVVDASRCVLQTVIERMAPSGELKHAPVRIYLRILSAAMFLLKTFALGAKEDDILVSLELMDQIVAVLRRESCDDVHLGLRFGELLEKLTRRVRGRFVRMQGGSRGDSPVPEGGRKVGVGMGKSGIRGRGIGLNGLLAANRSLQSAVAAGEVLPVHPVNLPQEEDAAAAGYVNGNVNPADTAGGGSGLDNNNINGQSDDLRNNLIPSSSLMPPPPHPPGAAPLYPNYFNSDTQQEALPYFNPAGFEDWLALPIDPIMGWSGGGGDHGFLGGGGFMGSGGGGGSGGNGGGRGGSVQGSGGGGYGGGNGGGSSGGGGGSSVTQTQMGVDVGGFDLLELLLSSEGGGGMGEL